MPVFTDRLVAEHFAPVRVCHQARSQVDVFAHDGVLAALLSTDDTGVGHAHGHAHFEAEPFVFHEFAQLLAQGVYKFQGAVIVVFKRYGRPEKTSRQSAFIAKIKFLEVSGKAGDQID